MAIYSCAKLLTAAAIQAQPYNQTITGVNDERTGTAFEAHTVIFLSNSAPINTIYQGNNPQAGALFNMGIARSTTFGGAFGTGEIEFSSAKVCTGCNLSRYSVATNGPSGFFGGSILDIGYISSISAGSFDLTWVLRTALGFSPTWIMLILGGTDWNIDIDPAAMNGIHATTAAPDGVLSIAGLNGYSSSFSSGVGAGSSPVGIGWAIRDGIIGCSMSNVMNQDTNVSAQLHNRLPVVVNNTGIASGTPIVSSWGLNSYTISGESGTALGIVNIAFSGNGIVCAAGQFNALPSDGNYTLNLGIDPQFIIFASVGLPDSATAQFPQGSSCIGLTDRTNLFSGWCGEIVIGNNPPLKGANYTSNQYLIQTATPNGLSTVMKNKMSMTPITDTLGIAHLTFADTDGTEPNIIWFAVGTEIVIPPGERGGGIYKMIPDRLNDKLYLDFSRVDTALFKIPNPNAYTSLIGDE